MTEKSALEALGIDLEEGLAYCADDPEFYGEMLAEYVTEGKPRLAELARFFEARAWADYAVRAHSVKSTSAMIGARGLAERARELELAAKEGDEKTVLASHGAFLAAYAALLEALGKLPG